MHTDLNKLVKSGEATSPLLRLAIAAHIDEETAAAKIEACELSSDDIKLIYHLSENYGFKDLVDAHEFAEFWAMQQAQWDW